MRIKGDYVIATGLLTAFLALALYKLRFPRANVSQDPGAAMPLMLGVLLLLAIAFFIRGFTDPSLPPDD